MVHAGGNYFKYQHIFVFLTFVFGLTADKNGDECAGFGLQAADFKMIVAPFASFSHQAWPAGLPQGGEGRDPDRDLDPVWTQSCSWLMSGHRKIEWTNRTQAGRATGNLLSPHLYRDLSPPQHPGSWDEDRWTLCSLILGARKQSKRMECLQIYKQPHCCQ